MIRHPPIPTLFPYTTLFRSHPILGDERLTVLRGRGAVLVRTSGARSVWGACLVAALALLLRSEEHTSELQSLTNLVCRLLLEKKKTCKCTTTATARIDSTGL